MLKRRITLSKKMAALKTDKARLLWFYMLPFTDVEGRINADPEDIRDEILRKQRSGYTSVRIQQCLLDLDAVGLIILYSDGCNQYLEFTRFKDEQNLNPKREAKTQIPAPLTEDSGVIQSNHVKLSKVKLSKVKLSKGKVSNSSIHTNTNVTNNSLSGGVEIPTYELKDFLDAGMITGLTIPESEACYDYYKGEQFQFRSGRPIMKAADACKRWRNNRHKFKSKEQTDSAADQVERLKAGGEL